MLFRSELRHAAFSADGIPFGGVTGVNEKGIAVAVHQNFSKDAGSNAGPMLFIGELILRQANTLEDAVEILRQNRPGQLWTFILSDLRRGQVLAIEASTRHFEIRGMEGEFFAQSNHLLGSASRAEEYISESVLLNSQYRFEYALGQAQTARVRGSVSAGRAAAILAAQKHSSGDLAGYEDLIKANTIQSVVLGAKAGQEPKVYMSSDRAPTASGRYVGFKLSALWQREIGRAHV